AILKRAAIFLRMSLWLTCAGAVAVLAPPVSTAQSLGVRIEADQLRVNAPQLRMLSGEPLNRLRDGAAVSYVFQLSVLAERGGRPLASAAFRFVVSYDLWEEKFAVTRMEPSRQSVSHLSAEAAEQWCLDSIGLSIQGLSPDAPLWVLLEFQAE